MKRIVTATALTAATFAAVVGGAGAASATTGGGGASATGVAAGSPGLLSGNVAQFPVNVPINLCGNTLNLVAALNPTAGNGCLNH